MLNNILNERLIKSISHAIQESLFGDELDSLFDPDENLSALRDLEAEQEEDKLFYNTLCYETNYNEQYTSKSCPSIYRDNENRRIYLSPMGNFENIKVRLRKNYNMNYFYRYILDFSENGKVILWVNSRNDLQKLIFNDRICDFIEEYYIPIDEIRLRVATNELDNIITSELTTLMIFRKKFSHNFVYKFPTAVKPGVSDIISHTTDKSQCYYLDRKAFESNDDFITLKNKLVNMGFSVYDDAGTIYNIDNINPESDSIEHIEDSKTQFVIDQLGEDYVDKFRKVLDYYSANGLKPYMKIFNCNNSCKINKANLIDKYVISDDRYSERIALYMMYQSLVKAHLNDWIQKDAFEGYYNYILTMFGLKTYEINDLPIKLETVGSLYKLYFALANAITYYNVVGEELTEGRMHVKDTCDDIKVSDACLQGFDFSVLNDLLKLNIDKAVKKYKLVETTRKRRKTI